MKKVRLDVAHVWAHKTQAESRTPGRGNLFHRDEVIYSYGSHFPIARHVTHKGNAAILFTTRSYSVTTSGHCSEVRSAIPYGVPVFNVDKPADNPGKDTLKEYAERIDIEKQVAGARKPEKYVDRLNSEVAEANAFAEFFGFKTRFTATSDFAELKEQVKAERARKTKADKIARAKAEAEQAERLARWIAGENVGYFQRLEFDRLRVVGAEVQTTRNATVPLESVKAIMPLVLDILAKCKTYERNGHTIHVGQYALDKITSDGLVVVGCHKFTRAEVERFAATVPA